MVHLYLYRNFTSGIKASNISTLYTILQPIIAIQIERIEIDIYGTSLLTYPGP
jgi:hypothetical protein